MEPIAAVGGIAVAIKSVADMVTGLRGRKKVDPETAKVLLEIETRLLSLEKEALGLAKENFDLQRENVQLRADISSKEEWAAERKKYQRKQVGKAVVLVDEDYPGIYFCPNCLETNHKALPLQDFPMRSIASHVCGNCKTRFKCH
jgi:hypothetical protein